MRRDLATEAVRLVYDRLRFVVGEVHPAVQHAVGREVVTAVGGGFYPVGAPGALLSPRPAGALPPPPPGRSPGESPRPLSPPHLRNPHLGPLPGGDGKTLA